MLTLCCDVLCRDCCPHLDLNGLTNIEQDQANFSRHHVLINISDTLFKGDVDIYVQGNVQA
jgi:hypothetical protein